jgi:probable HAF family extracellular repeat protein
MHYASLLRAGAASVIALAAAQAAQATSYHLVDLGVNKTPNQINKSGAIAGQDDGSGSGTEEAYEYRKGHWVHLKSGTAGSSATAIDGAGDVAGNTTRKGMPAATVWPKGGSPVQIALPNQGLFGTVQGIANGQVVAGTFVDSASSQFHCFRWTPAGGSTDIGVMAGGINCMSFAINSKGQIAGMASGSAPGTSTAFVYDAGGFHAIGALPAAVYTTPLAINTQGHVVGYAMHATGPSTAFSWDGTTATDLGIASGYTATSANGINDSDVVVGSGFDAANVPHALIFTGGQAVDAETQIVDSLDGWTIDVLSSINNDGVIVGQGTRADGSHGIMLVPVAGR